MADETYRYDVVIGVDVVADGVTAGTKAAEQSISKWEKKSVESIKKVQKAMDILTKAGFGGAAFNQDTQRILIASQKIQRAFIQTGQAREKADSQAARNRIKSNEMIQASDLRVRNLQIKNINEQRAADYKLSQDRINNAQKYQINQERLFRAEFNNLRAIEREERRFANAREAAQNKARRAQEKQLKNNLTGANAVGGGALAVGTAMTTAITAPITAGLIQSIKIGSQYEQSMNMLQAVTSATAEQMKRADEQAMRLGNDLTLPGVSAKDAAEAMTELGKAGLTVDQSIAAANGTLKLSIAANLDAAKSAEIVSNALNMFQLRAEDAGRVADLLAGAANASSAEITDVAMSLKQAGAVFAAAKVPIEDVVTLIAEMANQGIKGEDAGTALKTMMQRLQSPTTKAAEALKSMNIAVYDQQGKMKPMRDIIGQFEIAVKGLTDEQKALKFNTIFGSDAIKAANIVIGQGVAGFDKMKEAVMRQNAATELAAARTKGLAGAWDAFTSQLETIGLIIYNRIKKPLTEVVLTMAEFISVLTDGFLNLPEGVQILIAAFVAFLAILGPIIAAVGALTLGISALVPGLLALTGATTVGAALATLGPIILAIIAVIGALLVSISAAVAIIYQLSQAWSQGWGEIASVVAIGVGLIISSISPILGLPILISATLYTVYKLWETNFGGIRDFTAKVWEGIKSLVKSGLTALIGLVNAIGGRILGWWQQHGEQTKSIFSTVYQFLYNTVKNFLDSIEAAWIAYGPKILEVVSYIWDNVKSGIMFVLNFILDAISFWEAVFSKNWDGAWVLFLKIVKNAAYGLMSLWKFIQENSLAALIWLVKNLWTYGNQASLALMKAIAVGLVWLVKSFIELPFTIIRLVPSFIAAGKQIGSAIWDGIKSAVTDGGEVATDAPSVPFDVTKLFQIPDTTPSPANNGGGVLDTINKKLKDVKDTIDNIGNTAEKTTGKTNRLSDSLNKTTKAARPKREKATGKVSSKGQSILEAAEMLGVNPTDLATLISYETAGTFDPWKKGPTTQWGVHRGLIQWGEPQRKQYGITQNMSFDAQMDKVVKYMRDRGVKAGASLTTLYKAVNGGNVTVSENASDGYGTIRTHVAKMNRQHRKSAVNVLFGGKNPQSLSRGDIRDSMDISERYEVNPEVERMKALQSAQRDVVKTYQEMEMSLAALGLSEKDFQMATIEQANASLERLDKIKDAQKSLNNEYTKSAESWEEINLGMSVSAKSVAEFDLDITRMARSLGVSVEYLKDFNPNIEKTRENLLKIADKQLADRAAANLKEFVDEIGASIKDIDNRIALAGITDPKKKRVLEARQQLDGILASDKFKNASQDDRDAVEGEFWARYIKENRLTAIEKAAEATQTYDDKVKELNNSLNDNANLTARQQLELDLTTGLLKDLTDVQKQQLRMLQDQVDLVKKSEEAKKRIKDIAQDFGGIFADAFTDLFDRGVLSALDTLGKGLKSFFKNLMMQIVGGIATQVQSSITNMVMKLFSGKNGAAGTAGGGNTAGGLIQTAGGLIFNNSNSSAGAGTNAATVATNNAIQNLVPNLIQQQGGTDITALTGNVNTNPLATGSRPRIAAGQAINDITGTAIGAATGAAGKFSFGALGKQLGAMAPMLGMSLGQGLGGQSIGGQILGSVGGLVGGAALGIATGAIGASGTAMGGMVAALGGAMSATAILAPIAGVLLLGAWLLGRNKKRRQEETARNQLMLNAFAAMDKLIAGVNNNSIDGQSALSQADDIRAQYLAEANKLTDKKTKSHALQDVSRIDAKISTLKAAVAGQEARKAKLANLVPTFSDGGATSKFVSSNYQDSPLGYITGPGTEKSDSILALVSNKEYILDAETTKNIGVRKLDAIRRLKGLNLNNLPRYSDGGEVNSNPLNISDTQFNSGNQGSADIKIGVEVVNNIVQTENGPVISTEAYLVSAKGRKKIDDLVAQNIIEGRSGGKIYNALKGIK